MAFQGPPYFVRAGYSYHHPHPSDYSSQYSLEAYYHRLSAEHISNKMGASGAPPPLGYNAGPPPPPPDLQPIIDKTAEYVARNSEDFERTVLEKHCGDPKFGFLNPWNKYYPYYKMRLQQNKEKAAEDALAAIEKDFQRMQKEETAKGEKIQKLSQSGTVSFKLQPKRVAKVLETEAVDFGPLADEESEQEEDARSEGRVQSGTPLNTPYTQQESYQALQGGYMTEQNGYMTEDGSQAALDMNEYQDDSRLHPSQYQSYPSEEYVHYSSEGTYYYPSDNGELEVDYDEDPPDAKRAKTDNVVMDNKVQVCICTVYAVLCYN